MEVYRAVRSGNAFEIERETQRLRRVLARIGHLPGLIGGDLDSVFFMADLTRRLEKLADRARVEQLSAAKHADREDGSPRPPSARELQVLSLVAAGRSSRDIATALEIDDRTVESHIRRMADRYGVDARVGLIRHALREGWIDLKAE